MRRSSSRPCFGLPRHAPRDGGGCKDRYFSSERAIGIALARYATLMGKRLAATRDPILKRQARLVHSFEEDLARGVSIFRCIVMIECDTEFTRQDSKAIA